MSPYVREGKLKKFLTVSMALAIAATDAVAQHAQVVASGIHHRGKIIYSYDVTNSGTEPLRRVIVGQRLTTSGAAGALQLVRLPAVGPSGSFWLSNETAARPAGWAAKLVFGEEAGRFAIDWVEASHFRAEAPASPSAMENAPANSISGSPIQPGQTVRLSVVVDKVDVSYVTGDVVLESTGSLKNVPLTKRDATPPEITLNVDRINSNEVRGQWALFNVKASVKDNEDPAPELTMEPITSNPSALPVDMSFEKNGNVAWNVRLKNVAGRRYTIAFRAVDASGNASVKTFQYAVP